LLTGGGVAASTVSVNAGRLAEARPSETDIVMPA